MKRIVVTGANKGIGLAIVKRLLHEYPDTYVYLGSRDSQRGRAAIEQIISEIGALAEQRVELLELDVLSESSVQKAAESIKKSVGGNSNVLYGLVNNAGGGGDKSARELVELNMYGVRRCTEAFLPLIQNGGIFNVSVNMVSLRKNYVFELFSVYILNCY